MTLDEIAAKHGWVLKARGVRAQSTYTFTKGDVKATFCKAGHGTLTVTWREHRVQWPMRLEVDGKTIFMGLVSREEYADALLSGITEEECLRRIEEAYASAVTDAEEILGKARARLAKFREEANPAAS